MPRKLAGLAAWLSRREQDFLICFLAPTWAEWVSSRYVRGRILMLSFPALSSGGPLEKLGLGPVGSGLGTGDIFPLGAKS